VFFCLAVATHVALILSATVRTWQRYVAPQPAVREAEDVLA
jgi:hypothetical protein